MLKSGVFLSVAMGASLFLSASALADSAVNGNIGTRPSNGLTTGARTKIGSPGGAMANAAMGAHTKVGIATPTGPGAAAQGSAGVTASHCFPPGGTSPGPTWSGCNPGH